MLAEVRIGAQAARAAVIQAPSTRATAERAKPAQNTKPRSHEITLKARPGRPLREKVSQRT